MTVSNLRQPDLFISRQLSWLEFNRRVLELARDEHRPLIERLRFLAISAENLDGFFQKRVGALRQEVEFGVPDDGPWPHTPAQELAEVGIAAREMQDEQSVLWSRVFLPALAAEGLVVVTWSELQPPQRAWLEKYFIDNLYPILTPLAVDPGRPFPYISNLSLSLAVDIHDEPDHLFARVKVPANHPRWIRLPDGGVIAIEEVIGHQLHHLFRGLRIVGSYPFRVTRSADVAHNEADAEDLMDFAQEVLRVRRFAPVVRLEVDQRLPDSPRALLAEELRVVDDDIYDVAGLLALADVIHLPGLETIAARRAAWVPQPHPAFGNGDDAEHIFAAIRHRDVLVHHPYHDYEQTVAAFVRAAAADPKVLAVKQSLYRTSEQSATMDALIAAAESGKEVTALLELKARLDEAAGITWARRLEQSGIHTSYGFVGFKTHTRLTLVVRQEAGGLRSYVHLSTGDYNSETAREYSDLGLFTARPEIGDDVVAFFNFLTGYAKVPAYEKLIVAPQSMRNHFLDLIEAEIEHQVEGRGGRITAMMNALADVPLIEALYRASQAGVRIDLVIRRECGLRPGVEGVSENIRVRSVLGGFLEHLRLFHFGGGGEPKVYIGSADWMYRNLDGRIEAVCPVEDEDLRGELIALLQLYLADTAAAWELQEDGTWRRVRPKRGDASLSAQEALMVMVQGTAT
jgi:polyphosphate kinase